MKPDFMDSIENIIAEFRTRTRIDELDTEVLEVLDEILQDELVEYYNEAYTYGRDTGYDDGCAACKSILDEDVQRAYSEGYYDGYSDSYDDGKRCRL